MLRRIRGIRKILMNLILMTLSFGIGKILPAKVKRTREEM
jgi:hypothetical protein